MLPEQSISIHFSEKASRFASRNERRRQVGRQLLHEEQTLLHPEGFSLEQHLALRNILPDTYHVRLDRHDAIPYTRMVGATYVKSRLEGSKREKAMKMARQWGGLALGTVAFWALPWATVIESAAVPAQLLRSATAMTPYFFLNLPDSAQQYKKMLGMTTSSLVELATLPISLVQLGLWKANQHKREKARQQEIMITLQAKNTEVPQRILRKEAKRQAHLETKGKVLRGQRRQFAENFPQYVEAMRNILPDWSEEKRIDVLHNEVKQLQKQSLKESAGLLLASLGIPLVLFKVTLDTLAGVGLTTVLPPALPFIAGSVACMILRKSILRLYLSAKEARTTYAKQKVGKELLQQLALAPNA